MANPIEQAKHMADAGAGVSVLATWIATLTPIMNFMIVLLAIVWAMYRIHDMRLSIRLKHNQLAREHNERSSD